MIDTHISRANMMIVETQFGDNAMNMDATEAHVHNYALVVSRVMTEFCRRRFNLGEDWTPVVRCDFNPRRRRSWGGLRRVGGRDNPCVPFMSLVLSRYVGGQAQTVYNEYKRFASDPVIGSFNATNWEMALAALIAHEIAHCVQFTVKDPEVLKELGEPTKGHGDFWRKIYAILRQEFVNRHNIPVASFLYSGPQVEVVTRGDHSFGALNRKRDAV